MEEEEPWRVAAALPGPSPLSGVFQSKSQPGEDEHGNGPVRREHHQVEVGAITVITGGSPGQSQ